MLTSLSFVRFRQVFQTPYCGFNACFLESFQLTKKCIPLSSLLILNMHCSIFIACFGLVCYCFYCQLSACIPGSLLSNLTMYSKDYIVNFIPEFVSVTFRMYSTVFVLTSFQGLYYCLQLFISQALQFEFRHVLLKFIEKCLNDLFYTKR